MVKERMLRFAQPALYKKMIEIFSHHHIHPYDVQATIRKDEKGYMLSLLLPGKQAKKMTTCFIANKESQFEQDLAAFFEQAAMESKSLLMSDYYSRIKL